MRYVEFMKRVVPLHDDLFDFFYEALPGYEEVGRRRILLGCWGAFQDPDVCDFNYQRHDRVGPGDVRHARRRRRRQAGHQQTWSTSTSASASCSAARSTTTGKASEMFVTTDPLGNPVDRRHPWNQHTIPQPQKRDFDDKYTLGDVAALVRRRPTHLALDTGGGPLARLWATALAGLVNIGYVKATGHSVKIYLPRTALKPEVEFEWKIPKWSNTIERDRARTYFQAYAAAAALYFVEKALAEVHAGQAPRRGAVQGAGRGDRLRLPRGGPRRAVAPPGHQGRQDRQLSPVPADAVEREPARHLRHARARTRTRSQSTPIFEENGPDHFKGIDIMRDGPQLRSVPAVRRAHVSRQGQGARRSCTRPHRWRTPSWPTDDR